MVTAFLALALLLAVGQAANVDRSERCDASSTVVSGTHAPSEFCSGDIIFQEEFDSLDFKKWEHENTLGGGGVSIAHKPNIFKFPKILSEKLISP